MHVLVLVDLAAVGAGGEDRVRRGLGRMFSEDLEGSPLSRVSAQRKLYSVRLFDASTGRGAAGGGDLFEEVWALPRLERPASQATATRDLEQRNCSHIQLVSHAAFSSLAKHDGGDFIVLVGSGFPQAWLDAARSISQSKSFPGAGGVEFVFVDVNRVAASSASSSRVVELDEMLTAKPSQHRKRQRLVAAAAVSPVVPIVEAKAAAKKQLRSAHDILQELESGTLEFSDFAQAALALEHGHELAETLLGQPKFVHLGLVLLGRDSANVGRIKPLLIGLSIAWNQAKRFTHFLKEEWRPYCSEEVWHMVRAQFLEEEEAVAVARPQMMAAKSSVLDKVNSISAVAAATAAQDAPPAPPAPSTPSLVTPKIPLVLLKRNGQRVALNHFVGDYLSNPEAHFRQVRQPPTATAAKKPKPTATTTVAASPLRASSTCVPESPLASRAGPRLEMETPPPAAATPKRASAKRLFQE